MIEPSFWSHALQRLGYRQRAYRSVFSDGSIYHQVMTDLAKYSGAFDADPDGLTRDQLLVMHGRRQLFFRILNHLKLSPNELEMIYRPSLVAAATKLQGTRQGTTDDD